MLSSATKAAANLTKTLAEHDARSTASHAVHSLENDGNDVIGKVNSYAHDAGQKVRTLYDKTRDTTSRVSHNVESEIKTNPVRSSAIALGAGFILGALLTRR